MTTAEALRVIAMLAAYFRMEVADETGVLWAQAIRGFDQQDALEAARQLGLADRFMPPVSEFVDAITEVRNERLSRERPALRESNDPMSGEFMSFSDWLKHHATPEQVEAAKRLSPSLAKEVG